MLLNITSPKAYKHLREEGILPLPNPDYLRKLLKGLPCQFGFTDFVFLELKKEFTAKNKCDKQVFLVFDEMKVKQSISYDKATMQFTGFIDYAEFSADYNPKRPKKDLHADHALVFMIRTLNSKLVIVYCVLNLEVLINWFNQVKWFYFYSDTTNWLLCILWSGTGQPSRKNDHKRHHQIGRYRTGGSRSCFRRRNNEQERLEDFRNIWRRRKNNKQDPKSIRPFQKRSFFM